MLFDLIVTPEVEREIAELFETDEDAAAELDLLIERLLEDAPTLEDLCVPGSRFRYDPAFEVKRFGRAQRTGRNIFSVKYWLPDGSLSPYRLLIGFHAQNGSYYALQVADREDAYERGPGYDELVRRYDECGIPTY